MTPGQAEIHFRAIDDDLLKAWKQVNLTGTVAGRDKPGALALSLLELRACRPCGDLKAPFDIWSRFLNQPPFAALSLCVSKDRIQLRWPHRGT